MFWFLLFIWSTSQVRSDLIAYGDNKAEYGSNATFSCMLTDPTGVLQVTWQRLHKADSIETLATYNKRFGRQINEKYRGKVNLNEESLTSTAITVVNVTWADEACYVCSFNIYPSGSQRKQICVSVQGIASIEVKVQLNTSAKSEQGSKALVSCSANGRPTPEIQWILPKANLVSEPEQTQSLNSDQTVTTTSVIGLRSSEDSRDYVDCVVNAGRTGHRKERVLLPAFRADEKTVEQDDKLHRSEQETAMALSLMLLPLLTAFYLPKGLTQLVKTQNTVTVTLGEDAHINCQLMTDFKDILQVTWHKVSPQGTENVATYNKRVGPKVNARFARNVRFEEAGLRNCSIVVGGVSWEDEARYKCLFNAYPEGALTGDTRLRVYELHKPSIHVLENNTRRTASENVTERYPKGHQGSDGGQQKSTVSCSATGQPAPTVLWDAPANVALSNSTLSRVTNGNGTVTVTSTVTVVGRGLHGNVLVRCEASLFSRTVSKDVVMVIGFKDAAVIDDDEDTLVDSIVIATVACVVLIICGVLLLLWIHKRCHLNKPVDAEKRGTGSPPKTPSKELLTPHSAVRRTPHSQRKGYTSNEIRVPLNSCHSVTSSKGSASLDDGFRDKPHRKLKF